RSLNLMAMIWFQRDAEGIRRMRGLRDELQARLSEQGFYPSREGIDMLRGAQANGPRDEAWSQLKAIFDPQGIIAPWRYVPAVAARKPHSETTPVSGEWLRPGALEGLLSADLVPILLRQG